MENGVRGSNGDWEKRVKSYRNFKKKKQMCVSIHYDNLQYSLNKFWVSSSLGQQRLKNTSRLETDGLTVLYVMEIVLSMSCEGKVGELWEPGIPHSIPLLTSPVNNDARDTQVKSISCSGREKKH